MSSGLYDKGRQAFLEGSIAWLTDDIRVILIDTAQYTVNLATHDFLDDVAAGSRIAVSGALASKTSTDGVADAADVVFTAVANTSVEALIIYKHTGSDATARLIAYIDSASAGLPFQVNLGDVTVSWSNGASKIFKL